jgi:hypothetical protein
MSLASSFLQAFRINGEKAVSHGSTPLERIQDNVKQAEAHLPQQRALVAQEMTAAQRASTNADAKRAEVESLFQEVQTAMSASASAGTLATLKTRWATAKGEVEGLDKIAADAHAAADEAQHDLEGLLSLIQQSEQGAQKLKDDANLAETLKHSTELRQQVNDLKAGLGSNAADVAAVEDSLANARNAAELAKGSSADREMQAIHEKTAANAVDDAFAAELAARAGK